MQILPSRQVNSSVATQGVRPNVRAQGHAACGASHWSAGLGVTSPLGSKMHPLSDLLLCTMMHRSLCSTDPTLWYVDGVTGIRCNVHGFMTYDQLAIYTADWVQARKSRESQSDADATLEKESSENNRDKS